MRQRALSGVRAKKRGVGLAASLVLVTGAPAAALAHGLTKLVGNPKVGKTAFVTTCGLCHTLKAASTAGTIGPDLNTVVLTEPQIITAISKGGAAVMTRAAAAKYTTQMLAYAPVFSKAELDDIAAFVYVSTHK
jgi:mono/diheme cytochrome c family protein